jgi:hypothetical protein
MFKNIRIKMKGGGSRLQRVKVLASGKYKFVKNNPSRSTKLTKTSKKKRRYGNPLARRWRGRKRGKRKFTIPIAPIAGLVAAPALRSAATDALMGNFDGALKNLGMVVGIGFWDNKFHLEKLIENVGPMVVGLMVHKFVGGPPLNLNRALANAGVPLIRI